MSGCILLAAALALVGCTTPAPAAPAQLDCGDGEAGWWGETGALTILAQLSTKTERGAELVVTVREEIWECWPLLPTAGNTYQGRVSAQHSSTHTTYKP